MPQEIIALEQRQAMFAQLGTFVNEMAQQTGTMEVMKKKLGELEALRVRGSSSRPARREGGGGEARARGTADALRARADGEQRTQALAARRA